MQILLDVDGVIADFVGAAAKRLGRDASTVKTWNFCEAWGYSPDRFWSVMDRWFWADVPPTPEAEKVVDLCEKAVGAENVCLLSSPCMTDGCMQGKMDWICRHFPQFKRRFLFGPAKQFCAGPRRLLVDDSDANVWTFVCAGGSACLFARPWNEFRGLDPVEELAARLETFLDPKEPH